MFGVFVLTQAITYSPLDSAIYDAVTRDTPGAAINPLDFAFS